MIFEFIAKHRAIWPVSWMCDALGVSRSGFFAWLNRPPSARARSDEVVGASVRRSFLASDRTYGARRVWRDVLEEGFSCGLHRIERLMRDQALRARPRRRRLPPDIGQRQAAASDDADVVGGHFWDVLPAGYGGTHCFVEDRVADRRADRGPAAWRSHDLAVCATARTGISRLRACARLRRLSVGRVCRDGDRIRCRRVEHVQGDLSNFGLAALDVRAHRHRCLRRFALR